MPSELKTDASINGVVKVATDPKDRQGPTLSTKRVVETHITSRNHMTISLEETTGITMAFSPHYRSVHIHIYKDTNQRAAIIATLPLHRVHCMHHIPLQLASPARQKQLHQSSYKPTHTSSYKSNQAYSSWLSVGKHNPGREGPVRY
jgi:hypothetical protein